MEINKITFENMSNLCYVNIAITIIFCLAITIAYERSRENQQQIEKIINYW